ncbi:hypothetical protein ACPOL_5234 [Acidisarcina polymorpha]|uniref:Uncharacterized protein n=1 Tax=Acidisarcina polymorpha TaxID=2211140 RepID=A0A2Z5G5W7_9BACT|nr:hypothetical protein ACPOL_5234 [Acidisarcina polymorpha]
MGRNPEKIVAERFIFIPVRSKDTLPADDAFHSRQLLWGIGSTDGWGRIPWEGKYQ